MGLPKLFNLWKTWGRGISHLVKSFVIPFSPRYRAKWLAFFSAFLVLASVLNPMASQSGNAATTFTNTSFIIEPDTKRPISLLSRDDANPLDIKYFSGYPCVLFDDSLVYCQNPAGQFLDVGLEEVETISSSASTMCALVAGGDVYCWGSASQGALGSGDKVTDAISPQKAILENVVSLRGHGSSFCAQTQDLRIFCWGGYLANYQVEPFEYPYLEGASTFSILSNGTICGVVSSQGRCVSDRYYTREANLLDNADRLFSNSGWNEVMCAAYGRSVQCFGAGDYGHQGVISSSYYYPWASNDAQKKRFAFESDIVDVQVAYYSVCVEVGTISSAELNCWGQSPTNSLVPKKVGTPDRIPYNSTRFVVTDSGWKPVFSDGSIRAYLVKGSLRSRTTSRISGTLKTEDGQPLANARLSYRLMGTNISSVYTGVDGEFVIDGKTGPAEITVAYARLNGLLLGRWEGEETPLPIDILERTQNVNLQVSNQPRTVVKKITVQTGDGIPLPGANLSFSLSPSSVATTALKPDSYSVSWSASGMAATANEYGIAEVRVPVGMTGTVTAQSSWANSTATERLTSDTLLQFNSVPWVEPVGEEPRPVARGSEVILTFKANREWLDVNPTPSAGIEMYLSPVGGSSGAVGCTQVLTAVTNSNGEANFKVCPSRNTKYVASVSGHITSVPISVNVILSKPTVPTTVVNSQNLKKITVNWMAPTDDGGGDVVYDLERSVDGSDWASVYSGTGFSYLDSELELGNVAKYRVRAVNAALSSDWVELAPMLVAVVPTQVQNVQLLSDSNLLKATWGAPIDNGGAPIAGYVVEISDDGTDWEPLTEVSGDSYEALVNPGLAKSLKVRVSARNVAGLGVAGVSTAHSPPAANGSTSNLRTVLWGNYDSTVGGWMLTPYLPKSSTSETQVHARNNRFCYLTESGETYCYGSNWRGTLGFEKNLDQVISPDSAVRLDVPKAIDLVQGGHDAYYGHTCVLTETKEVYCWGRDVAGEVSGKRSVGSITWDENYSVVSSPVKVEGIPADAVKLYSGGWSTCVLTSAEKLYCWGGLDGTGSWTQTGAKLQSGIPTGIRDVFQTRESVCVLTGVGSLYCKGRELFTNPTNPAFNTAWTKISVGFRIQGFATTPAGTCVINLAGELYCIGANGTGFGHKTKTAYEVLTKVVLPEAVFDVAAADSSFCAASKQSVYCFGDGRTLGNGAWTASKLPLKTSSFIGKVADSAGANNAAKNVQIVQLKGNVDGYKVLTTMDVVTRSPQRLTGRVITASGTPVEGGSITWTAAGAGSSGTSASIRSNGTFSIQAQSGLASLAFNRVSIGAATTSFTKTVDNDSGDLGDIVIADAPGMASFVVRVKSQNGYPIPNTFIRSAEAGGMYSVTTHDGFSYGWTLPSQSVLSKIGSSVPVQVFAGESFQVFANVADGNGNNYWGSPSYWSAMQNLSANGQNTVTIFTSYLMGHISLDSNSVRVSYGEKATITGVVYDLNGEPLVNTPGVSLNRLAGSTQNGPCSAAASVSTNASGQFSMEYCPGSDSEVAVTVPSGLSVGASQSVSIHVDPIVAGVPSTLSVGLLSGVPQVSWVEPTNTGGTSFSYEVEKKTGHDDWVSVGTQTAVSLSDTSAQFGNVVSYRVRTTNSVGSSAWATSEALQVSVIPSSPRNVSVSQEAGKLNATWTAPENNGGADITEYLIEISDDGTDWITVSRVAANLLSATIDPQAASKLLVRVSAKNVAGYSQPATSPPYLIALDGTVAQYPRTIFWGNYNSSLGWMLRPHIPTSAALENKIVSRNGRTCYLNSAGETYCYGNNWRGVLGSDEQLNQLVSEQTPLKVNVPEALDIVAGGHDYTYSHTCVLTKAKEVYCWGRDVAGEVSGKRSANSMTWDENYSVISTPVKVEGIPADAVKLYSGGWSTCVTTLSEKLYCWGGLDNTGSWGNQGAELQTALPAGIKKVYQTREAVCVITGAGILYCRGQDVISGNYFGEWHKTSLDFRIQSFASSASGACVVDLAGNMWCKGANSSGFGHKTLTLYTQLTKVQLPESVMSVATTGTTFCAASRVAVYCMGEGRSIGTGDWVSSFLPVKLNSLSTALDPTVLANSELKKLKIANLEGSVDGFKLTTDMELVERTTQVITGRLITSAGKLVTAGNVTWSGAKASANGSTSPIQGDGTFRLNVQSGRANLSFESVNVDGARASFGIEIDSVSGNLGDIVIADPQLTDVVVKLQSLNGVPMPLTNVYWFDSTSVSNTYTFEGRSISWLLNIDSGAIRNGQSIKYFANETFTLGAQTYSGHATGTVQTKVNQTNILVMKNGQRVGYISLDQENINVDREANVYVTGTVFGSDDQPLPLTETSVVLSGGAEIDGLCPSVIKATTDVRGKFRLKLCGAHTGLIWISAVANNVMPSSPITFDVAAVSPTAPRSVAVAQRNGSLLVTWKKPRSDGGEYPTYLIERKSETGEWSQVANEVSATEWLDADVIVGTKYQYRLTALNEGGHSKVSSTSVLVQAAVKPSAPVLSAARGANGRVEVSWRFTRGAFELEPNGFRLQAYSGNSWIDVPGAYPTNAREGAYWDVASGQSYKMRVIATSNAGDSEPSNISEEVTVGEFVPQAATIKIKVVLPSGAPVPNVSVSWKKPDAGSRWIGGSQTNSSGEVSQLAETGPGVIQLSNIRIPGALSNDTVEVSVKPSQGDSTLTVVLPATPARYSADVMLKTVDGVPVPGAAIQRNGDNRVCLSQMQSGGTSLNICYYDLLGQNSATSDATGHAEFSMWEGVNPGTVSGTFTSAGTSEALYSQTSSLYSDGRETQLAISFVSSVTLETSTTRTNYGNSVDVVAYALKRDRTPYSGTSLSLQPVSTQMTPGVLCPGFTEKLSAVTDAEGKATFKICRLSDTQFQATGDASLVKEAVLPSRIATFITIPLVPLAPTELSSSLTPEGVKLTWTKSASGRGADIESQKIERSVDGGDFVEVATVTDLIGTWTDPEVLIGQSMTYRVSAVNSVGASLFSAISSITGAKIFDGPANLQVSVSSPGKVRVSYQVALVGALASTVDISCRISSEGDWTSVRKIAPASGSLVIESPCFGESVEYRVRLNNSVGIGAWSSNSAPILVYPQPAKPVGVSVSNIDASGISYTWTQAPSYIGLIFVGAEIQATVDGLDEPVSVQLDSASALTGGRFAGFERGVRVSPKLRFIYSVTTGGAVMSEFQSLEDFVPAEAPISAPRSLAIAQIKQTTAHASWNAPTDNGGLAVTGYRVSVFDSQSNLIAGLDTTETSITISDLDANQTYSVSVAAVNERGVGVASEASEFTTLIGAPSKVRNITATASAGNTVYELIWDAPLSDGGSPIQEYFARWSSDNGATWSDEVSSRSTTTTFSSIPTGRGLIFEVRARNSELSSQSEKLEQGVVPSTPLVSLSAFPGGLSAAWVTPVSTSSALVGYAIQVSMNGGNDFESYSTNAESNAWSLPVVSIGEQVSVRIAAINASGTSAYSQWLTETSGSLQVNAETFSGTGVVGTSRAGFILLDWDPITGYTSLLKKITATVSVYNQSGVLLKQRQVDQPQTGVTVGQLPTGEPVSVQIALCGYSSDGTEYCGEEVTLGEDLTPVTWPSKPENLALDQSSINSGEVTVDWQAPSDDGGAPIEEYLVEVVDQTPLAASLKVAAASIKAAAVTREVRVNANSTEAKLTGFQPGKKYRVTIKAKNSEVANYSEAIGVDINTPSADPAPAGLKLVSAATPNVALKWNLYPGSSSFRITCVAAGKEPVTKLVSKNSDNQLSGFAVNINYSCSVAAAIGEGFTADSLPVSVKVVALVPAKPAAPTAISRDGAISLTWKEPLYNNSPIDRYVITSNVPGVGCVVEAPAVRTCLISGLTNGTSYSFQVVARNAVGSSPLSAKSVAVKPVGLPDAPSELASVSALKLNTLTWTGATANGGTITKYEYRYKISSASTWPNSWISNTTKNTVKVKNWVSGSTYNVQVRVTNEAGSTISRIFTVSQTK